MFVSCECCVLSGRGLCDGPITRPEESCRVWCVCVWLNVTKCNGSRLHLEWLKREKGRKRVVCRNLWRTKKKQSLWWCCFYRSSPPTCLCKYSDNRCNRIIYNLHTAVEQRNTILKTPRRGINVVVF
jgi:hypothetical protein